MPRSPWYLLSDHLLRRSGGLETFVQTRRDAGRSWRLIARDLHDATKGRVDVTDQTLANWFPDDANGDEETAA
jgi:hypothetical protein